MTDKEALDLLATSRAGKRVIERNPELKEFLKNRYTDIPESDTWYIEAVWRLRKGIETRPVCPICGKPVVFIGSEYSDKIDKTKNGYRKACSKECSYVNPERGENIKTKLTPEKIKVAREKAKATCLERYGVENTFQSQECRAKAKATMMERYGAENTLASPILKAKAQQTVRERYGVDNVFQSEEIKARCRQTCQERYGVDNYTQTKESKAHARIVQRSEEVRAKTRATSLEKYGTENWMQSDIVQKKARETRLKNGTLRTSKEECYLFELLDMLYPGKVVRQYVDTENRYKWACDFYIPELGLFIEYNGSSHHGPHRYNPESSEDQIEKERLENCSIGSRTWCITDPMKQQEAKDHNLRYLAVYREWHPSWLTYTKSPIKETYHETLLETLRAHIESAYVSRFHVVGEY